jgi:UDP-glucose 4-epimerase
MNVLIFGGSGFLGSEINNLLNKNQFNCHTASFNNSKSDYKIDISNIDSFKNIPYNYYNIIINCATILPGKDFLDSDNLNKTYKTNILGTQNICNWIKNQLKIKKIINCSTLIINRKPWKLSMTEKEETYNFGNHVVYANSKLFQELLFKTFCEKYHIELTQVRFSALYGNEMPRNGLIWNLINEIKETNEINLKNSKKITIDYLNVVDASKIVLNTITNNKATGIINGISGKEISILNLAKIIKNNFKNSKLNNLEDENYKSNRSKISTVKLQTIINIDEFISLENGIKDLIKSL